MEGSESVKIIYIVKPYESQYRANKKYNENNRDKVLEGQKAYSKKRYDTDPEYKELKKSKARENYYKRKQRKIEEQSKPLTE